MKRRFTLLDDISQGNRKESSGSESSSSSSVTSHSGSNSGTGYSPQLSEKSLATPDAITSHPFYCLGHLLSSPKRGKSRLRSNYYVLISTFDQSVWLVHDAWCDVLEWHDSSDESSDEGSSDSERRYRHNSGWLRGLDRPLVIAKIADDICTLPFREDVELPLSKAVVSSSIVAAFVCARVQDNKPIPPPVWSNLPLNKILAKDSRAVGEGGEGQ
jgi:hypothetical protein